MNKKDKITKYLSRGKLRAAIYKFEGKFFYAEFVKKDGSLRKMIARTGVMKGIKNPTGDKPLKNVKNYLTVWDTDYREYRKLNIDTVQKINCNGITYSVID